MRIGTKDVESVFIGTHDVTAIYCGLVLLWEACNFVTRIGETFYTKDGNTFNVKD